MLQRYRWKAKFEGKLTCVPLRFLRYQFGFRSVSVGSKPSERKLFYAGADAAAKKMHFLRQPGYDTRALQTPLQQN
jgi:hypothetical protein